MALVDEILECVKKLPHEKQLEVLAYVKQRMEEGSTARATDIYGLWAGVEVSEDDIARVREEMR